MAAKRRRGRLPRTPDDDSRRAGAVHARARRRHDRVPSTLCSGRPAWTGGSRPRGLAAAAARRPSRTPTLRAICGQLIESRRARAIERSILRACGRARRDAARAATPLSRRVLRLRPLRSRATTLARLCRNSTSSGSTTTRADRRRPALARARDRPVVDRRDRDSKGSADTTSASSEISA